MTANAIEYVSFLRDREIELAPPLSDAELLRVEQKFGISFAADHAAMLQLAVPVGPQWPDWREDDDWLRERLAWPVDGVLFDVENSGFWLERWGPRPSRVRDAVRVARTQLADWPQPVPIYSH